MPHASSSGRDLNLFFCLHVLAEQRFSLERLCKIRLCVYYTEFAFMKFCIITTLFMLGVLRIMEVDSFWTLKTTNMPGIWVLINVAAAAAHMWFNCTLSCFLNSGFHTLYHPMVAPSKRSEVVKRKIVAWTLQNSKEYLSKSSLTVVIQWQSVLLIFHCSLRNHLKMWGGFNMNILERLILHINSGIQHTQGSFSVKLAFGRCLATSLTCSSSLSQRKQKCELYSWSLGGKNQLLHLLSKQYLSLSSHISLNAL